MDKLAIKENLGRIFAAIAGSNTQLIAVTKTRTVEEINYAIACGVKHIGENRVQELLEKYEGIDKENISIHLIGQLQTNKVKYIIDKVDLIHSVDSYKLAKEISKRAQAIGKIQDVLIEVNIGGEESKGGVDPRNLLEFISSVAEFEGIRICGLMCIPPKIDADGSNLKYFLDLKQLSVDINDKKIDNVNMNILSMGMSDDYQDAIKADSTFIRVGRGIFGMRN